MFNNRKGWYIIMKKNEKIDGTVKVVDCSEAEESELNAIIEKIFEEAYGSPEDNTSKKAPLVLIF